MCSSFKRAHFRSTEMCWIFQIIISAVLGTLGTFSIGMACPDSSETSDLFGAWMDLLFVIEKFCEIAVQWSRTSSADALLSRSRRLPRGFKLIQCTRWKGGVLRRLTGNPYPCAENRWLWSLTLRRGRLNRPWPSYLELPKYDIPWGPASQNWEDFRQP